MEAQNNDHWSAQKQAETLSKPDGSLQPEEQNAVAPVQADEQPHEPVAQNITGVSWEASEYIHHEKDIRWYFGLVASGFILIAVSIIWLKSITFTVLVVVMIGSVIFLATRPPRVLYYQLTEAGLQINGTTHAYSDFRAFGVVQDGAMYYVTLIPVKRFRPAVDAFFPQEYGEQIVDMLGAHVPMHPVTPDLLDRIARKLHF